LSAHTDIDIPLKPITRNGNGIYTLYYHLSRLSSIK